MYLNLWLPHITPFHTVTCLVACVEFAYSGIFSSLPFALPHKVCPFHSSTCSLHLPRPLREPCSVPSFPWRTRTSTKDEVGSPWRFIVVWHFPLYLPQDVTYVCTQGQESFKKGKERRRGENGGRGRKDQKGDKNSYFCLGQSFRQ